MNKPSLPVKLAFLTAGMGLGVAGASLTPLPEPTPDKVVTIEGAALEALDAECLAEIKQVEGDPVSCSSCEHYLGSDKSKTKGWCCNGAYMSIRVQRCLTAAVGG